jgi:hypothetical protein
MRFAVKHFCQLFLAVRTFRSDFYSLETFVTFKPRFKPPMAATLFTHFTVDPVIKNSKKCIFVKHNFSMLLNLVIFLYMY